MASRFAAVRVRCAHRDYASTALRARQWLLIEWPKHETESVKYFLGTLPAATPLQVTSTGQIAIPAAVRGALGVDDRVEFVEIAPGRYEFIAGTRSVTALKGMFGKPGKAVSIEQMNAVIARSGCVRQRHRPMIGLDTDVLVRHIMQDDVRQSPPATLLVESLSPQMPGFVPLATVVELAGVLSSAGQLDRTEIVEAFEALLRT